METKSRVMGKIIIWGLTLFCLFLSFGNLGVIVLESKALSLSAYGVNPQAMQTFIARAIRGGMLLGINLSVLSMLAMTEVLRFVRRKKVAA